MSVTRQVIHVAIGYPGRLVAYGVMAFVLGQMLYAAVLDQGWEIIGQEDGLVERTQAALAMFGAVAFFVAAKKSSYGKAGLVLCGSLAGYAAARECDQWLEAHLFNDAYKYLIGLPLLAITFMVGWKHRRTALADSIPLARTPAITMFGIAGIYLCAVCQVFDRPEFWAGIADHENVLAIKTLVEEFAEIFGYLLIAFAGVEAVTDAWTRYSFRNDPSLWDSGFSQEESQTSDPEITSG
jgi:hypothetical protein